MADPSVSGSFINAIKALFSQANANNSSSTSNSAADWNSVQRLSEASSQRITIGSIMAEKGPSCAMTADGFRNTLISMGVKLNEEQVASIIVAVLPQTVPSESAEKKIEIRNQWNLEAVAEVLNKECRGMNWILVAKSLDNPNLSIRSESDFLILIRLLMRISGAPVQAAGFLGPWQNKAAQLPILTLSANSPRNMIDFSSLITAEQIIAGDIPTPSNLSWICLPLYARFLDLANSGLAMDVLEILSKAAASYPEYFLVSLAQVSDPNSGVRAELLRRLLPLFTGLEGTRPTSVAVMRKLHAVNPDLLVLLCRIAFKKAKKVWEIANADSMLRSLGLPILRRIEEESGPDELLSFWCYRADRGELNLDEKLRLFLQANPKHARVFVAFAKLHFEGLHPRASEADGILTLENFAIIMRNVQNVPSVVPTDEVRSLIALYQQQLAVIGQRGPVEQSTAPDSTPPSNSDEFQYGIQRMPPGAESEEIEALANAYMHKIYSSELSIENAVALLRQFKASSEKREQEVFRCMIHNLLDEYRFFYKYALAQLQITGRLYGAIIQHQLIASITLGVALRYVLEALKKDPDLGGSNERMFRFGRTALEQFIGRMHEWPQFCSHLIQISHLPKHCPEIFMQAQRALNGPVAGGYSNPMTPMSTSETPLTGQSPVLSALPSAIPNIAGNSPSLSGISHHFANMNLGENTTAAADPQPTKVNEVPLTSEAPIDSTVEIAPKMTEIARMALINSDVLNSNTPAESIRDQIQFIVNNMAKSNFESKSKEIKEILKPEYYSWFANYLVVKKVSAQPNFHQMYLSVLDAIGVNTLVKLVLDSALHNVTKLLQSTNITTSSSERSLLRNLGTWLGQMTLARNKPLLQKRINLKELLFWGYETGRLMAVCSFVAKVVEGVKDSKVFRPPNPWLMALLGIMRELYEIEDLKLNIKFEVQVLCKNINIKMEDIPRGNVLTKCKFPVKDSRNPDFNVKPGSAGAASPVTSQSSPTVSIPVSTAVASPAIAPLKEESIGIADKGTIDVADSVAALISELAAGVLINSSLLFFVNNPNQRKCVSIAVERGVREIIQSAVERSVSIASTTTKQLILKDFCTEVKEQNLVKSAHQMVASLAGSLALATCKEPLRISIGNHLRTLLAQSISDQAVIEQIVQVCANDNVDICCMLIEKVSVEKAVKEMEESLSSAVSIRISHRESGQPFFDSSMQPTGKYLTDLLKPNPGGLLPQQLHVYEVFQRPKPPLSGATPPLHHTPTAASPLSVQSMPATIDLKPLPPSANVGNMLNMGQALETYQMILAKMEVALKSIVVQAQGREVSIAMLGHDSEIVGYLRDFIIVTQRIQPNVKNETAMTISENIFKRLFDSLNFSDFLRLEVFIRALEGIRDACGGVKIFNPDCISWLGNYSGYVNNDENSRRVYKQILVLLLRVKLLRAQDVDVYFVTYMDSGRNLFWLEIALSFIRQTIAESLSTIYDFSKTFDMVTKLRPTNTILKKQLQSWLNDIKNLTAAQDEQKLAANLAPTAPLPAGINAPANISIKEHVTLLLERWLRVWNVVNDQIFSQYLQLMHNYGVLKTEESADKFFRISTEICAEACLKNPVTVTPPVASSGSDASDTPATLNFTVIDALSKLFLLLIRLADKEASDMNVRVNLLSRILNAVARTLVDDHEAKKNEKVGFDQRPYYRLFANLSQDLGIPEPKNEPNPAIIPLLNTYTQVYLALQPLSVPGFAYAWIQLISRRSFMPHLLLAKGQKGWVYMHRLLVALFTFLQPFLKASQLMEPVNKLYKGALRVMLVLLHDFPEFLCDFHLSLCDLIPMNCIQLRNLVLSAFPRTMRLPDPFTPNLKVDSIPEIAQNPRISTDFQAPISGIKAHLDGYITTKQPAELPSKLPAVLVSTNGQFNTSLITSLVLYVGCAAIVQIQQSKIPFQTTAAVEIYKQLVINLDDEGRYVVLNAITNQLRYPNSHTHFFHNVLLHLFMETDEVVQEQITRVLFERLIVHRPHPVNNFEAIC